MADPAEDPDDLARQRDPDRARDQLLQSSYDAALEPDKLSDLMEQWEQQLLPDWRLSAQTRRAALEESGLLPHLHNMERIARLQDMGDRSSPEEEILRQYRRSAAFTLNRQLTVTAANDAALRGLGLDRCTSLSALRVRDEDRGYLARVVQSMLAPASQSQPTEPTRIVRARRLPDDRLVLLLTTLITPDEGAPFVLVTATETYWPPGGTGLLRDAYGLTPAEAEIMVAITRHHSLQDIADARQRSLETVRAQVKSIMIKTEARGQSDLLRIAMSVMDIVPSDADAIPADLPAPTKVSRGGVDLAPLPFQTLARPDGRQFDYLEFGAPDGRPVVYFSSTFGLCRWPASAELVAQRAGLRVIAPIRSGFGGSTPLGPRDDRVTTFAQDVLALMDHLGIAAAPFLVLDEDMVYAARLFRLAPKRILGVLGCGVFLPLTRPEQYERMGRWHRFVLGTARFAPPLLPFIVRVAFGMARKLGKPEFVRLVYGASPADVAMTRNMRMFEAVEAGSDVVLAEGFDAAKAYAQEISIVHRSDWRPDLEAMRGKVPVTNMIGTEDQALSPETCADLAKDYPWIEMIQIDNAGSFLFFQHWHQVLQKLDTMMAQNET